MKYVSIDTETSGLRADRCQILEFGAVIFDTEDNTTPVLELPSYRKVLRHEFITGQPAALRMNDWLINEIADATTPDLIAPGNLIKDFRAWLASQGMPTERVPVAGKNFNSFDKTFISNLHGYFPDLFKHLLLDPGNLYWDEMLDVERLPSMKTCMERVGMQGIVPHNSLDDARIVIELIRHKVDKIPVGY